jgi:hypothetical protein
MAVSFAEAFVRAYAERAVKAIDVNIDKTNGTARLTFYGREQSVNLRELVLQEDAFRQLGQAVNALLGIPEHAPPEAAPERPASDVTQLRPTGGVT